MAAESISLSGAGGGERGRVCLGLGGGVGGDVDAVQQCPGQVAGVAVAGVEDQAEVCRFVDVGGDVVAFVEPESFRVVGGADVVEDRGVEAGGVTEDDGALVGFL